MYISIKPIYMKIMYIYQNYISKLSHFGKEKKKTHKLNFLSLLAKKEAASKLDETDY